MFFICHVTTISKCHVILWLGFPHPKYHPARSGVHRSYGTNGACSNSSNSNSNAEVPMPMFTNGRFLKDNFY